MAGLVASDIQRAITDLEVHSKAVKRKQASGGSRWKLAKSSTLTDTRKRNTSRSILPKQEQYGRAWAGGSVAALRKMAGIESGHK